MPGLEGVLQGKIEDDDANRTAHPSQDVCNSMIEIVMSAQPGSQEESDFDDDLECDEHEHEQILIAHKLVV